MSIKHSVTIWRMRARHSSRISMWDNSDTTRKPLRAGPARVRYYDPDIGRFITQDPIGDGANWYVYADNNPVNAVDPTGLYSWLYAYKMFAAWEGGNRKTLWLNWNQIGNFDSSSIASHSSRVSHELQNPTPRTVTIYDTVSYAFPSGTPEAWTLGNVTLKMHGELSIDKAGSWVFWGNVKLVDYFDFDPDKTGGKATRGTRGERAVRAADWYGAHVCRPMNKLWGFLNSDWGNMKWKDPSLGYPVKTRDALGFMNQGELSQWRSR